MEREDRTQRPGADARGRPLRRFLETLGARPGKSARPPAWWSETGAASASRERQAEFWEAPAATTAVVEREPATEPPAAPVSLHVGVVESSQTILTGRVPEKGKIMSPLGIAKYLRLGGSVYDGRDEGRWLALPARKKAVPFQLMRNVAVAADDRRAWLSSERIGSRRSDGL